MTRRLPAIVDLCPENDPPAVAERDAKLRRMLSAVPGVSKPAAAEENDMTEELTLGPSLEEQPIPRRAQPSEPMGGALAGAMKFTGHHKVTLMNEAFTLKFTTSMFSVSEHALGFAMDKRYCVFEPSMSAQYDVLKGPNEKYTVVYAGGFLELGGTDQVLLTFMRVADDVAKP